MGLKTKNILLAVLMAGAALFGNIFGTLCTAPAATALRRKTIWFSASMN